MSTVVLTLFGEEIIPEQLNAVGRPKAKKAKAEPVAEPEQEPVTEPAEATLPVEEVATTPEAAATPAPAVAQAIPKTRTKKQTEPSETKEGIDFLEGWDGQKQYYTIGEVATLFRVKTSHIRFWTNEFALKVRTTKKGDRLYTPDQVREIRNIYYLVKEKRYTISGAKAKLKEKTVTVESIDLKKSLLHLRNKLLTIRNQLS